ncbi:hypothetical protein BY996DRAFT_8480464 [Phakopsora pachyrhizi]|nr:hypothetical protein BY996DRAFT_8480464 [Phakopsora pachyrhizi]
MAPIIPIIHKIKNFPPKQIIHPMSGFLKPGEMCMVLGRPNSGCSTLLKVLANQREGFVRVNGNVSYGGILADLMAKQVVYNPEDNVHFATLTVYQTLKFAPLTKTPRKLLPNLWRKDNTQIIELTNIHFIVLFVGDATRVLITEMMATRACLDASTALEYAKSLQIMTNIFSTTMFVMLYQEEREEDERVDYTKFINQELCFQQDFMEAVRKDQNKGVSKKSPYTVSVLDQMRALVMHDIQLSLQDCKTLIFDAVTVVGLAVVLGTVFLDLPLTTAGGITRGGVIFMGLLFNTFMSFSDLPKVMLGRPIVWRQTGFKFYRPGARSLASVIADVPFQFPKVILLGI